MTHLLFNFVFFVFLLHLLTFSFSSGSFATAKDGEYYLIDEQIFCMPLTRANLSTFSQKSTDSSASLSSSLKTIEISPLFIKLNKEAEEALIEPIAASPHDSGATSCETESLTQQSTVCSSPKPSSLPLSKLLRLSPVLTSLLSFLNESEQDALKRTCKAIQKSIYARPGHQLAATMPCLAALFAPQSRLNYELSEFLGEMRSLHPIIFSKFARSSRGLKPVTLTTASEASHLENVSRSFHNLQTLLWFLRSQFGYLSLASRLRFFSLFRFLSGNSHHFAFNLANPRGPFVNFDPAILPTDPFEELKAASDADLHADLVSLIRQEKAADFLLVAECIAQAKGPLALARIVYFCGGSRGGWTLLQIAAMNDSLPMINFLLVKLPQQLDLYESIAQLARIENSPMTVKSFFFPFSVAQERKEAALQHLLKARNQKHPSRPTALMVAVRRGNLRAAEALFRLQSSGADAIELGLSLISQSLLHLAVLSESLPMLKMVLFRFLPKLLLKRALRSFSLDAMSPLELTLKADWREGFELLIGLDRSQAALPHPRTKRLPLHVAAQLSSPELLSRVLLLSPPDASSVTDVEGNSPLLYALRAENYDNAHVLWSHFPDSLAIFRLLTAPSTRPLSLSILQNFFTSPESVDAFLESAPLLMNNITPLAALILSRHLEAFLWFLTTASPALATALLKRADIAGNLPIHLAVLCGQVEMFRWLMDRMQGVPLKHFYNRAGESVVDLIERLPDEALKGEFLQVLRDEVN